MNETRFPAPTPYIINDKGVVAKLKKRKEPLYFNYEGETYKGVIKEQENETVLELTKEEEYKKGIALKKKNFSELKLGNIHFSFVFLTALHYAYQPEDDELSVLHQMGKNPVYCLDITPLTE